MGKGRKMKVGKTWESHIYTKDICRISLGEIIRNRKSTIQIR